MPCLRICSDAQEDRGKIGIDATAKLPEEGYTRGWPEVVSMDPAVKQRMDALLSKL